MIKFRIIPSILYKDATTIRGKKFQSWRTVGSIVQTINLYSLREVDELIFLDVEATEKNEIKYTLINDFINDCFMPVSVGGGIKKLNQVEEILKCGADRVSINSEAIKNNNIVRDIIKKFGAQCLIVSVDYKSNEKGEKEVWINSGKQNTKIKLNEYLKKLNDEGVGEILLTSIEHDGMMNGYDTNTIKFVNKSFDFNVIASGGAGNKNHVLDTIKKCNLNAICCSSIFHFTEETPISLKKYLKENDINVRE